MKKFFLIFVVALVLFAGNSFGQEESQKGISVSWSGSYSNYRFSDRSRSSEWGLWKGVVTKDERADLLLSNVAYNLFSKETPPSERTLSKALGDLSELEAMQFVASTGSVTGYLLYDHQTRSSYSQNEVLTNIWLFLNGKEIRPTGSCGDRAWFVAKALEARGIRTAMGVFHTPGDSHVIDIAWAPSLGQFALIDWGNLTLTGSRSYKSACELYEVQKGVITPEVYTFVGSHLFIQQTEIGQRMDRAWGLSIGDRLGNYEFNQGDSKRSTFDIFSGSDGYSISWNKTNYVENGYGGTTIKAGLINPTSSALKSGIPYVLAETSGYKGTNPFDGVCVSGKLAIGFAYVPNREDVRYVIPADLQLVWGTPIVEKHLAVIAGGQFSMDFYAIGGLLEKGGFTTDTRAPMIGKLSAFSGIAARFGSFQLFLTAGVRSYFENVSNLNMFWVHWDFARGSLVHTRKHIQMKAFAELKQNYYSVGGSIQSSFRGISVSLEGERRISTVGAFSPNSWVGKFQVSAKLTDFLKISVKGEYEGKKYKIGSEEVWNIGMDAEVTF